MRAQTGSGLGPWLEMNQEIEWKRASAAAQSRTPGCRRGATQS
jgi:hypothetical protein